MKFPYPVLLCDIGGTNVRFAAVIEAGARLGPLHLGRTADHAEFEMALAAAMPAFAPAPRSLIVCAAGPVDGRRLKLTNAAWTIDGVALAERFGFAQGLLLNDFEAQALSLPALAPNDWTPIGTFETQPGPQIVLGSGTGLGAAALVEGAGRYIALPSEAGHVDFAPATAEEAALWPHIDTGPIGRVTAEMLLSGSGLVRLHDARQRAAGRDPGPTREASAITAGALADKASAEAASVRHFLTLLARFEGDLALVFLARGGVTFSGGIVPRLVELLDPASFRAAFEAKAPHHALMQKIGTRLVSHEEAVLAGMAAVALHPDRYAIDYAARGWRPAP